MMSNATSHANRLCTPLDIADFLDQCKGMADRINLMRTLLHDKLTEAGSTKNWDHITRQIGMLAKWDLQNIPNVY